MSRKENWIGGKDAEGGWKPKKIRRIDYLEEAIRALDQATAGQGAARDVAFEIVATIGRNWVDNKPAYDGDLKLLRGALERALARPK